MRARRVGEESSEVRRSRLDWGSGARHPGVGRKCWWGFNDGFSYHVAARRKFREIIRVNVQLEEASRKTKCFFFHSQSTRFF